MGLSRRLRAGILTAVVLCGAARESAAAERYYILVFGSESHPKLLRYTHTWATFVKAVGEGENPDNWVVYAHTISWLPRTLNVRVWSPFPEPGVNLDLYQSLAAVAAHNENVILWGPFLTTQQIYERSLWVHQIADSGIAQYRAISNSYDMLIADCIHAVAAVDPEFGRNHYPLIRIGHPASRFIAREIVVRSLQERGVDQAAYDNSWLIPRLGLCCYPITVVPPQMIPAQRCVLCQCPD
jgi:hypothetical protein